MVARAFMGGFSVSKGANLPEFERKPGFRDPVVGLGYHRVGNTLEVHASVEGGGFGVGTDVEFAG